MTLSTKFIILIFLFQVGKLSTGDSLDMSPQDEATIIANDATVKDMEVTSKMCYMLLCLVRGKARAKDNRKNRRGPVILLAIWLNRMEKQGKIN